jgi:hypothetical protein
MAIRKLWRSGSYAGQEAMAVREPQSHQSLFDKIRRIEKIWLKLLKI